MFSAERRTAVCASDRLFFRASVSRSAAQEHKSSAAVRTGRIFMIRLLGCDREKYTPFAAAGSSETLETAFFRRPFDVWQWAGEVALCSVGFARGGLEASLSRG